MIINYRKNMMMDWSNRNAFDFEYNRYQILEFVEKVKRHFSKLLLQPSLYQIDKLLDEIQQYKSSEKALLDSLKTDLTDFDLKNLRVNYKTPKTPKEIETFNKIIQFKESALGKMKEDGNKMSDFISSQIQIIPIGLMPAKSNYGYLFLSNTSTSEVHIYNYQSLIYSSATNNQKYISTSYLFKSKLRIPNTYEMIKLNLLKENKEVANPATYALESKIYVPVEATFLPIAKKMLPSYISK